MTISQVEPTCQNLRARQTITHATPILFGDRGRQGQGVGTYRDWNLCRTRGQKGGGCRKSVILAPAGALTAAIAGETRSAATLRQTVHDNGAEFVGACNS